MTALRTTLLALSTMAAAAFGGTLDASAQAYPNQVVRIIVPFSAGSITDGLARILADKLGDLWKQQVIVENRPGLPGTTAVAKSAPDGYTLMLTSNGHTIAGAINKSIQFDPVKDFAGVSRVAAVPLVKPNLVITCGVPPERFGGCAQLDRDSQLLLIARDDLPTGTSLRFLRGGSQRAELDVGQLKKGASTVQKLPAKLCSGVMRAKLQVQVLNQGRVAETLGPWYLSCG